MNWYKKAQLVLDIQNIHEDYHNGQNDYVIVAVATNLTPVDEYNGTPVGILSYSVYEDEIGISNIVVNEDYRRQGVATQMFQKLKEFNPGMSIHWGYTSQAGAKFRESVEGQNELV